MKVRFDRGEGVGSGTVREFFEAALKIPQERIGGTGKPVVYCEGQKDHLLPINATNGSIYMYWKDSWPLYIT